MSGASTRKTWPLAPPWNWCNTHNWLGQEMGRANESLWSFNMDGWIVDQGPAFRLHILQEYQGPPFWKMWWVIAVYCENQYLLKSNLQKNYPILKLKWKVWNANGRWQGVDVSTNMNQILTSFLSHKTFLCMESDGTSPGGNAHCQDWTSEETPRCQKYTPILYFC
jgi:hypothetical protein